MWRFTEIIPVSSAHRQAAYDIWDTAAGIEHVILLWLTTLTHYLCSYSIKWDELILTETRRETPAHRLAVFHQLHHLGYSSWHCPCHPVAVNNSAICNSSNSVIIICLYYKSDMQTLLQIFLLSSLEHDITIFTSTAFHNYLSAQFHAVVH